MARSTRSLLGILLGAGLLLVPVAGAPFAAAGNPCFHGYDVPPLSVGPGTDVKTLPCAFEPTITTIATGETITFRNEGPEPHLVTGANGEWGNREAQLDPGSTVAYTFTRPGVYPYACSLHPGMSGAIVVGDGGPALAAAIVAAGGPGNDPGSGSGVQAGDVVPASGPPPDRVMIAVVAALVGAALALAAVMLAVRSRSRRPGAESADATTSAAEPVSR